jgi:RimJ/RimL family protein N-acetyltransferase
MEIRTPRLLLRPWQIADREPFARLNADPRVMEHFASPLTRDESDRLADRLEVELAWRGWGLCAVEIPGLSPFAGFIGLSVPSFEAAFTPCVEVGWRLAADVWGAGYATEGAQAAIAFGFETLNLGEIVSFTVPGNLRSRRVMERLGMSRDPDEDFDHPSLPIGHPLRRHVLYRRQAPSATRGADR